MYFIGSDPGSLSQMWSEAAKAEHPERWNGRATRDWSLPDTVYLNPDKVHEQSEKADEQMAVS